MKNIDEAILTFVKPTRMNFGNLIYNEREYFQFFDRFDFRVTTFDSKTLSAILFKLKTNTPSELVCLYTHTHGSCKSEGAFLLRHCYKYRMSLCIYDSRGCGESSDSYLSFGHNERTDMLFILLKLNLDFHLRNVLLWGRSIGCAALSQMYYLLVTNEADFLNKRVELAKKSTGTQGSFQERMMERSKSRNILQPQITNFSSEKHGPVLETKYPLNFNSLIYKHFDEFCRLNGIVVTVGTRISLKIIGGIFDSPYTSVEDFIGDNIARLVKFVPGLASSIATIYFKNWTEKTLGFDIDKNQNRDLFPKINLNSAFIFSRKDEIIPFERYKSLVSSYASKCLNQQKPLCFITEDKHCATRKHDSVHSVLESFFGHLIEQRCFSLTYCHLDYRSLMAQKIEKVPVSPAIKMYNIPAYASEARIQKGDMNRGKSEIKKVDVYGSLRVDPLKEIQMGIRTINKQKAVYVIGSGFKKNLELQKSKSFQDQ